jgi:hypothetical protein
LIKSSISKQITLDKLEEELRTILKSNIIKKDHVKSILIAGWEAAVEKSFDDNILTKEEEFFLTDLSERFDLTQDELDRNGMYSKVVKGAVLRDILEGKIPERVKINGNVHFNLLKMKKLSGYFKTWLITSRKPEENM